MPDSKLFYVALFGLALIVTFAIEAAGPDSGHIDVVAGIINATVVTLSALAGRALRNR